MSFENERLQSKQLPLVIERPQAIKFQIWRYPSTPSILADFNTKSPKLSILVV